MKGLPTRQGFGDEILRLGQLHDDIYVIDCDISKSCKTADFACQLPNQHINVGIAEQNAAGIAAGLATMGKVPFISTYAVFGSMRMLEQIRTSACYPNLNVKVACSHGGLTPASDGATHQGIEDMGIYRTIPNMTVIMPADYNSTRKLVEAAYKWNGPVYLRFTRDEMPLYYDENEEFEIGKGKILKEGKDITIIAIGDLLHQAIKAAEELEKKGISVRLIDMFTLKPLDEELVLESIKRTGKVITVEDHNIYNGLSSAVSEVMAENGIGKLKRIAIKDHFGESGDYYELLKKYDMDEDAIVRAAYELLEK
ncbi:transketolase family protein [Clostridium sp.]|uniref:transketolase family protein n=1 Tax=Clostridium sp. TaxID=1506 RepID=UPI003D6CB90E